MEVPFKRKLYDEYVTSGQAGLAMSPKIEQGADNARLARPYVSRVIRKFIPSNRQIRILDLGCGHGGCLIVLKRHGYTNIAGVDLSREQVDAALRLGISEVVCGDALQFVLQQKNPSDVVFLMDVLEHLTLPQSRELLLAVFENLAPQGRVIIHVPNGEGLFGMRIRYGDLTHESCFTPKSIRQLLFSAGFQQIQCLEDKPIPHGVVSTVRRIIWDVGTLFPRLLLMAESGWGRFVLSQNILVVAKKF